MNGRIVNFDKVTPLSEALKSELQRRVKELDANPTNVLTWEQIKASIVRSKPEAKRGTT
jgi:putative addiction module component (TIGR02574 family)